MRTNIVNVVGGLGNQLFQYAFGIALERRTRVPTSFDLSDFQRYRLHGGFALERFFDLRLRRPDLEDVASRPLAARTYTSKRIAAKLPPLLRLFAGVHTDESFSLERPGSLDSGRHYFFGYWQSQTYSEELLTELRTLLRFRPTIQRLAHQLLDYELVDWQASAAVHIRRADYLRLSRDAPQYALPMTYYGQAMDTLAREVGVRRFFVFSDDVAGVRNILPRDHDMEFVGGAGVDAPGVDLALISRFTHVIISNSSFSWWAAALRGNCAGATIAPRPWLNPAFRGDRGLAAIMLKGWREQPIASRGVGPS